MSTVSHSNYYGYIPNLAANVVLLVVFFLLLVYNIVASIRLRQWWFGSCWSLGLLFEAIGYAGRTAGHSHPGSFPPWHMQEVTTVLGTVFMIAALFPLQYKWTVVLGVKAKSVFVRYPLLASTMDLVSLGLLVAGTAMFGTRSISNDRIGTRLVFTGSIVQIIRLAIFLLSIGHTLQSIAGSSLGVDKDQALNTVSSDETSEVARTPPRDYAHIRGSTYFTLFPVILILATAFLIVRCVYRVVQMNQGFTGKFYTHEVYFLVLDGMMLALSGVTFLYHPGLVFKDAYFPVRGLDVFIRQ